MSHIVDFFGTEKEFRIMCKCEEQREQEEADAKEQEAKRRRVAELYDTAGLGARFDDSTFAKWIPKPDAQPAFEAAMDYVERWPTNRAQGTGLLLYGPPGTGKSHLAAAIVHALIHRGAACVYQSVPELLDRLRRSYDRDSADSEGKLMAALDKADLLVLDDLGAEKRTEWVESTLYRIVDARYRHRRATVITSNLSPKMMGGAIGERSWDRLLETCALCEVKGRSHRRETAEVLRSAQ